MTLLQELGGGQGYLKAGFLGFSKSGKTYTATLLAIAVKRLFKIKTPIALFDTEGGSEYIVHLVKELTKSKPVGVRARSFDDLLQFGKECEKEGLIAVVDSITHPWRELCAAYLKEVNEKRAERASEKGYRFKPQTRLEFQDWNTLKERWSAWTDFYLNSQNHIVICGRAGYEYDFEKNDDDKRELVKTGIKMKTESEFGFEPSLLVEMGREQDISNGVKIIRRATVLGDRFGVIDGKTAEFKSTTDAEKALAAVQAFFAPHLDRLAPGVHAPIDVAVKSQIGVDDHGEDDWAKERKQRAILCEEIQGVLVKAYPGQTAKEKAAKLELIERAFNTRSWTKVEGMESGRLRAGLAMITDVLNMQAQSSLDTSPPAIHSSEIPF